MLTKASLTLLILPTIPPLVMTSSPFCKAAIMARCSLATFICGRMIMKKNKIKMTMSGKKLINSLLPVAPAAYALEINTFITSLINC